METKEAGPWREEPGWGRGMRKEGGVSELKASSRGKEAGKTPASHRPFPPNRLLFLF